MSPSENIAKALELKESGNQHFKAGEYKKAMTAYHEIFMYVHGFSEGSSNKIPGQTTQPVTSEEMRQIRELKLAHHSNLAMCHMKLGNVQKAQINCSKALAIDPKNVKALFRRGKCYAQLNALDEAKADLDAVLSLEPGNNDAKRELQALKSRFASHRKKEQKKFAGMFDKLSAEQEAEAPAQASPVEPPKSISVAPVAVDPTDASSDPAAYGFPSSPAGESSTAAPGTEQPKKVRITADGGAHKVQISRREGEKGTESSQPAPEADADDDGSDDDLGEPLSEPQAFVPSDVTFRQE